MLYAITDRRVYAEKKATALKLLVELAEIWAANGVSFIQIREKDLSTLEQVELARAVVGAVQRVSCKLGVPGVLVHSRVDVALAAGADGVHLASGGDGLMPDEVRRIFAAAGRSQAPVTSISCHTVEEVQLARRQSPTCILFAPVFEKMIREPDRVCDGEQSQDGSLRLPGTGLVLLKQACRAASPVPVFALGGVNAKNAADCLRAGAAGIAAIRLMQEPAAIWQPLV